MDLNALYALQSTGVQATQPTGGQNAAATTQRVDFDSLLASLQQSTGTAESYATSEEYALSLQQELLAEISERVNGAPNYLYSLHPKVYEKMSTDPEFMEQMLGVVDEWTNSAAFTQARSASDLMSSLLAGEDGEYVVSSAQMGGLGGGNSILDFIVSDENLTQEGVLSKFLSQFSDLPAEYGELLASSLGSAQVAGGGADSAYYQSLAATAEVQKRLLDL